jgi:hypothetical protein
MKFTALPARACSRPSSVAMKRLNQKLGDPTIRRRYRRYFGSSWFDEVVLIPQHKLSGPHELSLATTREAAGLAVDPGLTRRDSGGRRTHVGAGAWALPHPDRRQGIRDFSVHWATNAHNIFLVVHRVRQDGQRRSQAIASGLSRATLLPSLQAPALAGARVLIKRTDSLPARPNTGLVLNLRLNQYQSTMDAPASSGAHLAYGAPSRRRGQ